MSGRLIRPQASREVLSLSPEDMDWQRLGYRVLSLRPGDTLELETSGRETAVVPMSGSGSVAAGDRAFALARLNVFEETGGLLYLPPDVPARLTADTDWVVALGTAPAEGRYPPRLVAPHEIRSELRGGGTARRQVNHMLAPPIDAERLIVFEVFVPAGSWAGWPPHCHDGSHGSPYLEETYYVRFDRPQGFGLHRNYTGDGSYDETFTLQDGDCVAVPRGFHVTASAPGSNMWILNFLAGELIGDARAVPPYFDPETTWITDDWSAGQLELPVAPPEEPA